MTQGEVKICYETYGSRDGVPLLFIQGFSAQLIGWRQGFCHKFVDRGAFVIVYDNRDVGLSQKFGGPTDYSSRYAFADMAGDGLAVLDDLGLESAHVVGASMGGMLAQTLALAHPHRVRSLNLIYTAPKFEERYFIIEQNHSFDAMAHQRTRDEVIAKFVEEERRSASTAYPQDEDWVRQHGGLAYDRCYAPAGVLRQAMAVVHSAAAARPEALAELKMPASIIHGRADRRIRVEAALELGRLLGNSEVHIYPGLGHEIPEPLWNEFAEIIMRTAARA